MIQKIDQPVSVTSTFNHHRRQTVPLLVNWNGRLYRVIKVGLHHTYRSGRTLFHVFSVQSQEIFFRLSLNTDNLSWNLDEISDDLSN